MPRPRALPAWIAVAIACAAVPPPALHAAVAATAGTLFEAAPFVLAGSAVRLRRIRWFVPFVGCGCSRRPGWAALSLPAAALTWLSFGPMVALARFAAGALSVTLHDPSMRSCIARALHRHVTARPPPTAEAASAGSVRAEPAEPFAELEAIALQGFVFGLAVSIWQWIWAEPGRAEIVRGFVAFLPFPHLLPALAVTSLSFAAGAVAGTVAPCTTAAVAVAVVLRAVSPAAAYGMLSTAGLCSPRPALPVRRGVAVDARPSFGLLALACMVVALRDGHGFINPRLVPLSFVAAAASAIALRARPTTLARLPAAAPALMLVALVLGSPLPVTTAAATEAALEDLFAGQHVDFVGRLAFDHVRLVRDVISCCRADASPVAIRLARPSSEAPGTWLAADGIAIAEPRGFALDYRRLRRIAPPADPFAYR